MFCLSFWDPKRTRNQQLLVTTDSMLVCRDSYDFLFAVISITMTVITKCLSYWDAHYTYCSCSAKRMTVCPWPPKTLLSTRILCRTSKRQQWLSRKQQTSLIFDLAWRKWEEVDPAVPTGKVPWAGCCWPAAGRSMSRRKAMLAPMFGTTHPDATYNKCRKKHHL